MAIGTVRRVGKQKAACVGGVDQLNAVDRAPFVCLHPFREKPLTTSRSKGRFKKSCGSKPRSSNEKRRAKVGFIMLERLPTGMRRHISPLPAANASDSYPRLGGPEDAANEDDVG